MMTIFWELVCDYIKRRIERYEGHNKSQTKGVQGAFLAGASAAGKLVNLGGTFWGGVSFFDSNLSSGKLELTKNVDLKLKEYGALCTDAERCAALVDQDTKSGRQGYLVELKEKNHKAASSQGCLDGFFGTNINETITGIQDFFSYCKELGLLDLPITNDQLKSLSPPKIITSEFVKDDIFLGLDPVSHLKAILIQFYSSHALKDDTISDKTFANRKELILRVIPTQTSLIRDHEAEYAKNPYLLMRDVVNAAYMLRLQNEVSTQRVNASGAKIPLPIGLGSPITPHVSLTELFSKGVGSLDVLLTVFISRITGLSMEKAVDVNEVLIWINEQTKMSQATRQLRV